MLTSFESLYFVKLNILHKMLILLRSP
jgi:hypothetical protein